MQISASVRRLIKALIRRGWSNEQIATVLANGKGQSRQVAK
jgi:hypothetical protein